MNVKELKVNITKYTKQHQADEAILFWTIKDKTSTLLSSMSDKECFELLLHLADEHPKAIEFFKRNHKGTGDKEDGK